MEIPEILDLFTDGTCMNPACEITRLGAWGVVLYQPNVSGTFAAISSGILGGIHQTVTRAELQAAIMAAHIAFRYHRKYRLWIDNAYVIKVIKIVLKIVISFGHREHQIMICCRTSPIFVVKRSTCL